MPQVIDKMKITRKQIRKMILETMNISEGTLYVTRSPYGMMVEDDDDNYISIGDMVQALLAAGQDDFFRGPQGVDPEALAKLSRKNAEGVQGGMLRWDADVFEDYYNVDNDRVLRLFARLNNHSIKELPYQD